jgi:hypothetical protein
MAQVLIRMARRWYANEDFGVELEQTAYALDSTTIDLCLSLFPWAHFRRHKAAIKLHTLIDLQGNIPCFIRITHGKIHDVNILDQLVLEAGAFYMMDRGYIDFARLYLFVQALAFFVTRAKSNLDYQRMAYRPCVKCRSGVVGKCRFVPNWDRRMDLRDGINLASGSTVSAVIRFFKRFHRSEPR